MNFEPHCTCDEYQGEPYNYRNLPPYQAVIYSGTIICNQLLLHIFFKQAEEANKKQKEHSIIDSFFSLYLLLEVGEAVICVDVPSWFVIDK